MRYIWPAYRWRQFMTRQPENHLCIVPTDRLPSLSRQLWRTVHTSCFSFLLLKSLSTKCIGVWVYLTHKNTFRTYPHLWMQDFSFGLGKTRVWREVKKTIKKIVQFLLWQQFGLLLKWQWCNYHLRDVYVFEQICFEIWRNTFSKLDKYIWLVIEVGTNK